MKKISFNSPVILSFTILSLGALILNSLTNGYSNAHFFSVYRGSLLNPLFYLRLFTHVLGHANFEHYANNMIMILLVGPLLEEKYGSKCILEVICIVAVITGIAHCLISPYTALLGASGVVFAFILLSSITGDKGSIPLTTIIVAIIYISQQVTQGLVANNQISEITHILGGTIGGFYGFAVRK